MYIPANLDTTQFQDDNLLKKTRFWLPIALAIFLVLIRMENNTAFTPIVDRWAILLSAYWPALADWMSRSAFPPITGLWFSLLAILFPYYVFLFSCHKPYADKMVNKWLCAGVKRHLYPLLLVVLVGCFTALAIWVALPEEKQCRYDCVHKVVIIQMIYGSCLLLSNCYLWSMVFFWLKNFNVIHLNHT